MYSSWKLNFASVESQDFDEIHLTTIQVYAVYLYESCKWYSLHGKLTRGKKPDCILFCFLEKWPLYVSLVIGKHQ